MPRIVAVSDENAVRLVRVRGLISKLPEPERVLWRARVASALRRYADGVEISGEGGETEWDLQFANWLDGVSTTLAERTSVVLKEVAITAEKAAKAAGSAVRAAGFSMWPLVLAAIGVAYAMNVGRR